MRGRLVVDQAGHGVQIAEGGVDETGHQRSEPLVVLRLRGGRGGAERPAVEAALEGNDLVTLLGRVQPGELDGRLVGLGAGVAEERLAAETSLRQGLGPLALQFRVPGVGHVDQLAQLLADGLDHRRRAMSQQVAAPAVKQVEVAVPFRIPHVRSLAPHQGDRKAIVVGNHVSLEQLQRLFGTHRARCHVGLSPGHRTRRWRAANRPLDQPSPPCRRRLNVNLTLKIANCELQICHVKFAIP